MTILFVFASDANALNHKVKKGETLFEIAKDNGTSVKEIKKVNRLQTSKIHPGDVIAIPVKVSVKTKDKHARLSRTRSKKSTRSNENEAAVEAKPNLAPHVVERGENLYRIASTYGISVKEIKKINHLSGKPLKIGQKILVPTVEDKEELPDTVTVDESSNEAAIDDADKVEQFQSEDENVLDNVIARQNDENGVLDKEKDNNWISLMDIAMDYLGVPYRFGGSSLKGIDCSAFVQTVYKYFSIDLPRTAREQFKAGVRVSKKELRIGDLIFFRTYAKFPSHVGIYVGEGKMIHASSREKKVTISSINEPFYVKRFIGAVRLPENLSDTSAEAIKALSN